MSRPVVLCDPLSDEGSVLPVATIAEIHIINDGKPGHLNQSMGLARAIQAIRPDLEICLRPPMSPLRAMGRAFRPVSDPPVLIIGAGHKTHLTLLALKRATGAPVVVMMSPSLPLSWFDLCLIPAHDNPPTRPNVVVTQGAVNLLKPPTKEQDRNGGMILVGGPSDHFQWQSDLLVQQVLSVAGRGGNWTLATSRRTPVEFLAALQASQPDNLKIEPFNKVPKGWLAENLPLASHCWVTPDSVSMVYEALTAGCAVGVFELLAKGDSRVVKGLAQLSSQGWVTAWSDWLAGRVLVPVDGFDEAARCAQIVVDRLISVEGHRT
jgi:uncharacterized protein